MEREYTKRHTAGCENVEALTQLSRKQLAKIAKSNDDIDIPNSQLDRLPKINLLNLLNGV